MIGTVEQFIQHWRGASGGERAQSQSFLLGLCQILGVEAPKDGDYKFEYAVPGEKGTDFIDLYKRGAFVLEAKQSRAKGGSKAISGQEDFFEVDLPLGSRGRSSRAWDVLMLNARQQAENYARHLPSSHEWPPFIVVCDVGHCFELYADFTGKGRNYTQFPDRQGFRIFLDDLAKPEIRERLVKLWTDPHALDPTKRAAKATREIAERLAAVSKRLEAKNYPPEEVALFLMRCLFTMFAEDTELIPKGAFTALLKRCVDNPKAFMPLINELWTRMNLGGFSVSIEAEVKCFNGHLFADARVFPMEREEIGELEKAAAKDWREVDPSIFGTLLEQALDPKERARLGAHYTPRAYVERLVIATIIEPLREEWNAVLATAERLKNEKANKEAVAVVHAFHEKLCETRVLDPACGTGNFLYIALELMKRLEGEVLETLLNLGGQEVLAGLERHEVDPHQFLGMEINPRAAAIAELVLWIGYLRWHLRTRGTPPSEPILKEFRNIQKKDAVLEHDGFDAKGNFVNPRRPQWPEADYIVGNPPFIGKGATLRDALGEHYVAALWKAHGDVNQSADFVMYWWDQSADLVTRKGTRLKRFGLVTTNSISQFFNRRVIERHLTAPAPISIVMAIPDHPWTKASKDFASVRIAMTVGEAGTFDGTLKEIVGESALNTDEPIVNFRESKGRIGPQLTIGVDATSVEPLKANAKLASMGPALGGRGFVLKRGEASALADSIPEGSVTSTIRPLVTGRDITDTDRHRFVLDVRRFTEEAALRESLPKVYQHLKTTVFPVRSGNNDPKLREFWWQYRRSNDDFFDATSKLRRYIATVETAKHRVFVFVEKPALIEHGVVGFGLDDPFFLGVLNSWPHTLWALSQGGTLEDRPRYNKLVCFDPFPFPEPNAGIRATIARLAEAIERHRKDAQATYPKIKLTHIYNVVEKLRGGKSLTNSERAVYDHAVVLVLRELHDDLDKAVADAYGWPHALADEEILARLVALNRERAAEEARGHVRWLRPDYQISRFGTAKAEQEQIEADLGVKPTRKQKASFPRGAVEQTAAVMAMLAGALAPLTAEEIARNFTQGRKAEKAIAAVLFSLVRTGFVASLDGGKRFALRRAA